jgi:hypothetical protein
MNRAQAGVLRVPWRFRQEINGDPDAIGELICGAKGGSIRLAATPEQQKCIEPRRGRTRPRGRLGIAIQASSKGGGYE